MPVQIDEADEISRCIIFDRAFEQNIHVDEFLWQFESSGADGNYHQSAVLRRLAPEPSDVHAIGCAIAASQNARKNEPPPGPNRRYYCGYRTASVASLPKQGDGYEIVLTNVPEDGEEAHVDVALIISVAGKNARAARRTDAGLALAEHFGPPEAHRCQCDDEDDQHPFSLWGEECLTVGMRDRWPALIMPQPSNDDLGDEVSWLPEGGPASFDGN